jgi:hypothetical protein
MSVPVFRRNCPGIRNALENGDAAGGPETTVERKAAIQVRI